MRRVTSIFALTAATLWLYGIDLTQQPLTPEELRLAAVSSALASPHDSPRGAWLPPLFLNAGERLWLEPMPLYAGVALMKVRASSAPDIRFLPLFIGTFNLVLVYLVADRVFSNSAYAFVAGAVLALSPAYFTYSRLAVQDGIWVLPFVAGWLLAMSALFERPGGRNGSMVVACGAALLAGGLYTQPSAAPLVLALVCVNLLVAWKARRSTLPDLYAASAAFIIVCLPLCFWFALHRSIYAQTFGQWLWMLHPSAIANWFSLGTCAEILWDFFTPSYLFLNDQSPAFAGVFLLPVGVLIVRGIYEIVSRTRREEPVKPMSVVVLTGFVLGPLAAATFREPRAIQRALIIVPFGVLLATLGLEALWTSGNHLKRGVAILLLVATPLQFLLWSRGVRRRVELPGPSAFTVVVALHDTAPGTS